jgi:hypothetical protein
MAPVPEGLAGGIDPQLQTLFRVRWFGENDSMRN